MREKKKSLRLKKFKIANLNLVRIHGGNSNPCQANTQQTTQQHADSDTCCTRDNSTCSVGQMLSDNKVGCNGNPPPTAETLC